jgi:asparagine synthase (glutamine-hydrolysing)
MGFGAGQFGRKAGRLRMCGIAGIYYFHTKVLETAQTVKAMASAIAHRGMDDEGFFENEHLVLAHQRLSIIDLKTGHQPISNEDGSVVVACNGEIYNFRELRKDLKTHGHSFSTTSDTEVIVHLYEDFGLDMFNRLNGIFAFALWDNRKERLILARDHFGVKPLHVYQDKDRVLFASEIKSILVDRQVSPTINMQAFHYFMNLRYVPGKETLFKGVERLLPGEYAVVNHHGFRRKFYWRIPRSGDSRISEASAIEGIRKHLAAAVSRQLVADVPVGIYLSGGMDSSSILAMAHRDASSGPIDTYTLGFNEPTDEIEDAKRVANCFHTRHRPLALDPKPLQCLPEVLWYVEEPKINMLQGFLLAQHARRFIKVALAGLGGDELFAGYLAYQYMKPSELFHRWLPCSLTSGVLQPLSKHFFNSQKGSKNLARDEYRRGAHMLLSLGDKCQYYGIIRNVWDYDSHLWAEVYGPRVLEEDLALTRTVFEPYFADRNQSFIEQAIMAEFETKLVDDFLLNEDRVSMAHGLEVRVPFLDRDLVSFATQLPVNMKLRGMRTKYIFKKAMRGIVPEFVLKKKKWGFAFNPYFEFQKDLKETAQKILTPARVKELGLFNYSFVKNVLNHRPHPRLRWHYFTLWMMVGFHIWHEMFIQDAFSRPSFELESYFG